MDPLQEVPTSKWPELRDLYMKEWPNEIEGYCSLDTQISTPGITQSFNMKVYSPGGDIHNGMIIVSDLEEKCQMCICPVNKDLTAIEKALLSTKVIDWRRNNLSIASVKPYISECVQRVCKKLGVVAKSYGTFNKYLFQDSTPLNLCSPPNTYTGPLKPEHLTIVDKAWAFHSDTSHLFFRKVMENDFSYVLYSDDHQPIAWIQIDQFGCLSHLYCVEKERRKGYAEFITKVAINDLRKKGRYVLGYSLVDNIKSKNLFAKLKFDILSQVSWISLCKN